MRVRPNFGKKEPAPYQDIDDPWGCVRIPLVVVVSYFVLMAIARYASGTGSKLDQVICFGALAVFTFIMLLGFGQWMKDGLDAEKEKQQWKRACRSVEVPIVGRQGFPGGSWEDEYGIPHTAREHYSVTLRLSNQTDVKVTVSKSTYEKLEQRDSVRIYYRPESPLTFMLEEEI